MEIITKILYWISTGLMIPVMILLIILFVHSLMTIGVFYTTYVQKIKFNRRLDPILETLDENNIYEVLENLKRSKLIFTYFLNKIIDKPRSAIYREKQLTDFEIACHKDLSSSQNLSKLGPILGLMGTLIPMGPALVGLASGDIASMALNMQVAFSTTVIGLLIGAVGFVISHVKKQWYAKDINNLEYIVELLNSK